MILRQAAFTGSTKMLKGNLHIHTTRSDGPFSPEETIRRYAQAGYDFLAITDHRIYNYQNYAPDVPITIIPSMEMDGMLRLPAGRHCFHIGVLGHEQNNGFAQDQKLDSAQPATPAEFQTTIDQMHAAGNLTFYCHPEWSCTPARVFEDFTGNFAMEIWNSISAVRYGIDTNAPYWDELLDQGKRVWGMANDDCHKIEHYFGGWNMVNAENNVDSILEALQNGAFYATCGPEIYDFRIEDGICVLECSPVSMIGFHMSRIPHRLVRGENLTRAEWPLSACPNTPYVRAFVRDAEGRRAWTNPIFLH